RKPPAKSQLMSKLDEMGLANELSFMKPAAKKEVVTPSVKEKETAIKSPVKENETAIKSPVKEKETVFKSSSEVVKRETEIVRTVLFRSDSLVISLYDNGEIDGDTVSLVLNGNIILAKQG